MEKYHKIKTVFSRNPETNFKTLLEDVFATPEFEYLQPNKWRFTEKVDGTNIRVDWSPINFGNNVSEKTIRFGGKTDNTQVSTFLFSKLQEIFTLDKLCTLYPDLPMTLYGEGYGAKIQKGGGNYISDGVSFILFDVFINGNWLDYNNVLDIADKLGIKVVPCLGIGTLPEMVEMVKKQTFVSELRSTAPEGIVARPVVELQDRIGSRIITKLKLKDFKIGTE